MSLYNFPKYRNIRLAATNETIHMGSFKTVNDGELSVIKALFYIKSRITSTERFRFKVYSESSYTSLLYTSAWTSFSTYPEIANVDPAKGWHGWVPATFSRENVSNQCTYYLAIQLDNYTINALTYFISLVYDTPVSIYDNSEARFYNHPLAFIIEQYEDIA